MKKNIGVIGMAVMGKNLALNIADHGYSVAIYNRTYEVTKNVLFRGDSIEVVVDVDGTELKARRGLDEQAIEVGEEVDVFLYRIFGTVGDKAYLLDNKSISEDSLVI